MQNIESGQWNTWFDRYAFPDESGFNDIAYAEQAYTRFAKSLLATPTTRLCAYATTSREATEILMKVLKKYGFAGYVGKVNMDRNSSPGLLETTRETIAQTRLWLEETKNGIGAIYPILTPRYFPSCTESCLQQLGQLAEEYHVPVQSHLSEGLDEIDWVRELAPDLDYYAQAYDRAGLLGSQTQAVMAHCIFSSPEEVETLKRRNVMVAFYSLPITDYAGGNFSIIHGEVQDVWYRNGVLAAMYSTTDKIGFIGSLPIPDVIVAIDAFALGAQSIKPEIDITAVFTGSWADTGLQTTSVNQLIDSGCDVIAPFQDSIKTMMEICRSRGVHCFGCNSDAYELDPQTWLSACITDWSGYIPYLKQAIDGEYEPVNISGGMELNLIKQATFGDTVSDEIVAKLGEVREQLINKEIAAFEGPIYAQDGSVMFEDGYRPTIEEINVIDQLVQGVKGSMN